MSMDEEVVNTPASIERRMMYLSKAMDEAVVYLNEAEKDYKMLKAQYELAAAEARYRVKEKYATQGLKATVQDCADEALMSTKNEYLALALSETTANAAKENRRRLEMQIEIARSVSASVRSSMAVA
jgi:hypothetical protein